VAEPRSKHKPNCWEFKKCGREAGGPNTAELGVCPASVENVLDGVHGGANAGRACWVVGGTLCNGAPQGTFAKKIENCLECRFYGLVKDEEGDGFVPIKDLFIRMYLTVKK
jgi:hypothetical protein